MATFLPEEKVTILIVMKDNFYFELLYKPKLNQLCDLKFVNSLNRALAEFEASKFTLDFVVLAPRQTGVDNAETSDLLEKIKSDPKFKGKVVGTVYEFNESTEMCGYDSKCLFQNLVAFITPLIVEVQKVKQEAKRAQNERSKNRVMRLIDSWQKKFA